MTGKKKLTAWTEDPTVWIDLPAPYCVVKWHTPQIKVDSEFHEWFVKMNKKQRGKVGLE